MKYMNSNTWNRHLETFRIISLLGVFLPMVFLFVSIPGMALAEPQIKINKKDETKDLPAIETVAADPGPKL
ncbi:MAG: hypothetical protein IPK04_06995 [Bdellovibrionales bacterium]|nr:hypothetical protein [Bdellovibrionales bacterium]